MSKRKSASGARKESRPKRAKTSEAAAAELSVQLGLPSTWTAELKMTSWSGTWLLLDGCQGAMASWGGSLANNRFPENQVQKQGGKDNEDEDAVYLQRHVYETARLPLDALERARCWTAGARQALEETVPVCRPLVALMAQYAGMTIDVWLPIHGACTSRLGPAANNLDIEARFSAVVLGSWQEAQRELQAMQHACDMRCLGHPFLARSRRCECGKCIVRLELTTGDSSPHAIPPG